MFFFVATTRRQIQIVRLLPGGALYCCCTAVYQVCESSLNTLVNLRGTMSFVAETGTAGQRRLTNGKDGGSIEVRKKIENITKDVVWGKPSSALMFSGRNCTKAELGLQYQH